MATIEFKKGGNFKGFKPTFPPLKVTKNLEMRVKVSANESGYTEIPGGSMEIWMEDSTGAILDDKIYTIDLDSGITYNAASKVYTVALNGDGHALFTWNFILDEKDIYLKYQYMGDPLFKKIEDINTSSAGPLDIVP